MVYDSGTTQFAFRKLTMQQGTACRLDIHIKFLLDLQSSLLHSTAYPPKRSIHCQLFSAQKALISIGMSCLLWKSLWFPREVQRFNCLLQCKVALWDPSHYLHLAMLSLMPHLKVAKAVLRMGWLMMISMSRDHSEHSNTVHYCPSYVSCRQNSWCCHYASTR